MTIEEMTALIEDINATDFAAVLGIADRVAKLEKVEKTPDPTPADPQPEADAFGEYAKTIHGIDVE